MASQINILNQSQQSIPSQERLNALLHQICETSAVVEQSVELLFLTDEQIRPYYKEYFGEDRPTDVIAFPMEEDDMLGCIVVSVETAERQAAEHQKSLWDEIRFLIIHGFLHLLGHDHAEAEEKQEMQAKERELLALTDAI